MSTDTRPQFEDATWAHYQGLKARGWSAPEEGDPSSRESLFWRQENGQYGVRSVEAAWRGWQMREVMDDGLVKATLGVRWTRRISPLLRLVWLREGA